MFLFEQNGVCVQVIATGRKGHIVSIQQSQDGDVLTVEVEDVGVRALRPTEVRPVAPQIVSCVLTDRFCRDFQWEEGGVRRGEGVYSLSSIAVLV